MVWSAKCLGQRPRQAGEVDGTAEAGIGLEQRHDDGHGRLVVALVGGAAVELRRVGRRRGRRRVAVGRRRRRHHHRSRRRHHVAQQQLLFVLLVVTQRHRVAALARQRTASTVRLVPVADQLEILLSLDNCSVIYLFVRLYLVKSGRFFKIFLFTVSPLRLSENQMSVVAQNL
jgi:hypothetical protein